MNISFANTDMGRGIAIIFGTKAYSIYFHNKNYWKKLRLYPSSPFLGFQNKEEIPYKDFFNKRAFYCYPLVFRKHSLA